MYTFVYIHIYIYTLQITSMNFCAINRISMNICCAVFLKLNFNTSFCFNKVFASIKCYNFKVKLQIGFVSNNKIFFKQENVFSAAVHGVFVSAGMDTSLAPTTNITTTTEDKDNVVIPKRDISS